MADLKAIRTALKAALVARIGEENQQVSAYVIKNPTLPVVWVRPRPDTPIQYHQAMGNGLQYWEFLVEAHVGAGDDIGAQMLLDSYVSDGASSIFQALEADVTLNGLVQNLVVRSCANYVEYTRADSSVAVGANWQVEIYP